MYGDCDVMRKRVAQLREQGVDIRGSADRLVSQVEAIAWTGRAADSLRERIRDRAAHLRDVAARHDSAADSLERHLLEVEGLKEAIGGIERKATMLTGEARGRMAQVTAQEQSDRELGVRRTADPDDQVLAAFTAPPSGHRDWLSVDLPGLRQGR